MKDSPNPVECHPQPRSTAFRKLSPQCDQQALDILPAQICARRLSIDGFKDTLMPALHDKMISYYDIAVKIALGIAGEAG